MVIAAAGAGFVYRVTKAFAGNVTDED